MVSAAAGEETASSA